MFVVHIWDRSVQEVDGKQSLKKIKLSDEFSKLLITLPSQKEVLFSDFCLDDYSLYDSSQYKQLIAEIEKIAILKPNLNFDFLALLKIIKTAEMMGKDILFDPFEN